MRPRTRWTGLALLAALAACSGANGNVKAEDQGTQPKAVAADSIESRFARAYFEIGCIANAGKDPESTFTPLREPCDYLLGLRMTRGLQLERAVQVLQKHGFMGLDDFRDVRLKLKARKDWWQKQIDARFIDELKRCR